MSSYSQNRADLDFAPSKQFAIGTPTWINQAGTATFSNVRLRRLDEKPDTEHLVQ